jgi:His/Glu/Gln/Arg/opine family amino acid ABC transporter permease subunit
MSVWEIFSHYHRQLLVGLRMTLLLCFATYSIGFSVGITLGVARYRSGRWLDVPCRVASILLSALPLLVLLFWLHYPLQYMLQLVIKPVYTAIAALSLIMSFMVADVVTNALQSFPEDLVDAARVAGMSRRQTARLIQRPIILRQVIPHFLFIMVVILQGTLFTSLISVEELFRVAQEINADIYKPVPIYTALAVFFIVICASLNLLGIYLRSRLRWKIPSSGT